MKIYRVRWRDGAWQVTIGEAAIGASDNREHLVELGRIVAARHDGELYVCDKNGKLEVTYTYKNGAESVREHRPSHLRVVHNSTNDSPSPTPRLGRQKPRDG